MAISYADASNCWRPSADGIATLDRDTFALRCIGLAGHGCSGPGPNLPVQSSEHFRPSKKFKYSFAIFAGSVSFSSGVSF